MTATPLRVAVIGYGVAGRFFHAPLVAAEPAMTVVAIVTGVVATPNRTRVPLARAAIAAGVPVVVDTPLAPDGAQVRALVDEAEEAGVMLTVFQNRRWDADLLTVRRLLAEGAVGAPVRFESRFDRWRPRVAAGVWRERPGAEDAGGLLADLGSHLVAQALQLFGRSWRCTPSSTRAAPGRGSMTTCSSPHARRRRAQPPRREPGVGQRRPAARRDGHRRHEPQVVGRAA